MTSSRLLYLAFWYPPSRASGVYRAMATVHAFHKAGWEVTVVTVNEDYLTEEVGSVDSGLLARVPEQVRTVRVPFDSWGTDFGDLRAFGWLSGNFPRLRRRPTGLFPDKYQAWIEGVLTKAVEMHEGTPFSHILATGNPYSSFEAARLLSQITGVPYSVDFRDPWSFDVYSGSRVRSRRIIRAETSIVDGATFCFHVNPSIADGYSRAYPQQANKQVVATNGYDEDSIGPPRTHPNGPFRFGVLGTITERWPLHSLFAGWSKARPALPAGSELVIAGHLGYFANNETALRSLLPSPESGVVHVGAVPKADVRSFYSSLDVVVVPVPGGRMVTSGKIYEAMALGVPLVCIQEATGGARELISNHPLAVGADPNPVAVGSALVQAARATQTLTEDAIEIIRSQMVAYERQRALRPIVERLTTIAQ